MYNLKLAKYILDQRKDAAIHQNDREQAQKELNKLKLLEALTDVSNGTYTSRDLSPE